MSELKQLEWTFYLCAPLSASLYLLVRFGLIGVGEVNFQIISGLYVLVTLMTVGLAITIPIFKRYGASEEGD